MESRNYSENAMNTYRKAADVLEKYLAEHNTLFYNREIGNTFLSECKLYRGNYKGQKPGQSDVMRTMVYFLNGITENGKLGKPPFAHKYSCPDCFLNELNQYLNYQRETGKKESTVSNIRSGCTHFLNNLEKLGVDSLFEITPQKIFVSLEDYPSKVVFGLYVPPFLKYLHRQGILSADYSTVVPHPTLETLMPTVYEKDEIEAILSSVDRTQIKGKRDYAMLLLAARLGLRVSDIITLTFGNIHNDKKTIEIIQQKTGVSLTLPLLDEIENAIREYTAFRPENVFQEIIFLRAKAPYVPMTRSAMYCLMQNYLQKANIDVKNRTHGPHALRSSLASTLVAENVPYAVTQKILGHTDSDAIKHYVRLDIEQLRGCALDVPSSSGNFSTLLGMKGELS